MSPCLHMRPQLMESKVYSLNPNILKTLKTSSSAACVDTCGNTPGCLSADWNRTSTNCYIQKEPGPAKSNNTDVDSAWLMPRPNCPSSDGFIRVFHGQAYKLSCGKQAAGNRTPVKAASIGECVDMCAGEFHDLKIDLTFPMQMIHNFKN